MSRLTIANGTVYCDCVVYQNGEWLVSCTDPICSEHTTGYLLGRLPPKYPVPAPACLYGGPGYDRVVERIMIMSSEIVLGMRDYWLIKSRWID